MNAGKVDRYRDKRTPFIHPPPQQNAYSLKYIEVKPYYIPIFLKQRNKMCRGNTTELWVVPADQSLRTAHCLTGKLYLRLEKNLKIAVFNGAIKGGTEFLLPFHLFCQIRSIKDTLLFASCPLASRPCAVLQSCDVHTRFINDTGSLCQFQTIPAVTKTLVRININIRQHVI